VDPAYHGYFLLPGTQTLLTVGGFFKTDDLYDLRPTDSPDQFIPSSILIPAVEDVHNANVSISLVLVGVVMTSWALRTGARRRAVRVRCDAGVRRAAGPDLSHGSTLETHD
jgi:hypothetical protein